MSQRRTRWLALALALTLAMGIASGVGYADAAADAPTRITVFAPNPAWGPVNNDVWLFQEIGKRTNTQLDFVISPSSNSLEKFNMMIAGGEVPDFVMYSFARIIEQKDSFLPLNDLIDSDCPNYTKLMQDIPDVRRIVTQDDGNIYTFAYTMQDKFNYCFYIRKDWLDKLNLQVPVTLEDWVNVLTAFRDGDPNGNGVADEIPFLCETRRLNGSCEAELSMFTGAWGLDEEFYSLDGQTIQFGGIDPRMKDALVWYRNLYSEKLLDQEYFVDDAEAYENKMQSDLVGAWVTYVGGADDEVSYADTVPGMEIVTAMPPIGPAGKPMMWMSNLPFKGNVAGISKNASPEAQKAIMSIFNYTYSDEGQLLTNFGEEGKTFLRTADGGLAYAPEILNSDENPLTELRKFGIGSWWPMIEMKEYNEQLMGPGYREGKAMYEAPGILQPNIQWLTFTDAERSTIAAKYTDIKTYIDETFDNIITGKQPIEDFDALVDKVKSMGIDELVGIYNDALTRWNNK